MTEPKRVRAALKMTPAQKLMGWEKLAELEQRAAGTQANPRGVSLNYHEVMTLVAMARIALTMASK